MTNKIYVGNLDYSVEARDLEILFGTVGEVVDVQIVLNPQTGISRGFAFVEMADPESAKRAIKELTGKSLKKRLFRNISAGY